MELHSRYAGCWLAIAIFAAMLPVVQGEEFLSHRPMRPLPTPSQRPMSSGHSWYVDAKSGNDTNAGTQAAPWRTIQHALGKLKPGDVLYLRGGVYWEHVSVNCRGTSDKPITIRSFPGELAIVDGGLREFFEQPESAWEPSPSGAADEFRSVKTYPDLGGSDGGTNVLGNFGDSMIPLHGYRYLGDLRNANEYFSKLNAGKTEAGDGVYCGPGVFYDVATQRIHVRLAHTHQKALKTDNYRGETDPRKLPLVIAGMNAGAALSIDGARYVRIQDIVVRGARGATVSVSKSFNIEFDGVTAFGGSSAIAVRDTAGLRLWNCALRGIAAPWTYRGSLKYRAIEARIFSASGWSPTGNDNRDFELAYSEFTDCVDGVFIGNVNRVRFHHNLLDNVSDDGIFLTSTTAYDGNTPGGDIHISQNLLSRCLTTFAFGVGHGRQKMTPRGRQTGAGVFIYRNVFDFRRPVMYTQPDENETQITSYGRVAGDHGGPLWEPMTIYHNTILQVDSPFRAYYLDGLGGHLAGGSMRRLFNNIVVHASGKPGHVMPPVVSPDEIQTAAVEVDSKKPADPLADLLDGEVETKPKQKTSNALDAPELAKLKQKLAQKSKPQPPLPIDFQADGNLHWSYAEPLTVNDLFSRFRDSAEFANSKKLYPPGWSANDIVADPQFAAVDADWRAAFDPRLEAGSPGHDSGVSTPREWPDPLRGEDRGKSDVGAIPAGVEPWPVGIRGRLTVGGRPAASTTHVGPTPAGFLVADDQIPATTTRSRKPVVVVEGYPAFDAPLIHYALNQHGIPFEALQRTWLAPSDYSKYSAVIVVGNLARAKIEPNKFSSEDLRHVQNYLKNGGKLVLMRGNTALFGSPDSAAFLRQLTGGGNGTSDGFDILQPKHPWLKHIDFKQTPDWVNARNVQPISAAQGEVVIGSRKGFATLYRVPLGKGQLVYIGWDIAASLPNGRSSSTVEQEIAYEQQWQVLSNVVGSLTDTAKQ